MTNDARQPVDVPAGKMRVWDPEQKKVIFVTAPVAAVDRITLTLRIHDAAEKQDEAKSASWIAIEIERADLGMAKQDFIAKYVLPNLDSLKLLALS